jgi:DNA-binding transcriptional MocR family regulator
MQLALADFLATRRYDNHLKRLRQSLVKRQQLARQALIKVLPAQSTVSDAAGGYFLWVTLPDSINTTQLYQRALAKGISIAPGQMFAAGEQFSHCFRLNTAWPWDSRAEAAVVTLGEIMAEMAGD